MEPAAGEARLAGYLTVPQDAPGIVVFAHGSGSSRHSPRNRYVARVLTEAGLGTLLFDLLTPEEELDRANVFDIGLLPAASPRSPGGCGPSPAPHGPPSATSGPAREPRPRYGPQRNPAPVSGPWCPAAGVWTSPAPGWRR